MVIMAMLMIMVCSQNGISYGRILCNTDVADGGDGDDLVAYLKRACELG